MGGQVGISVARELMGMGVTLMPKRFEIWFMYRNGEEPALAKRIDDFLNDGGRVSNAFLDSLASEFIDNAQVGASLSQRLGELNRSSSALMTVSDKLNGAIANFGANAENAAAALEIPGLATPTIAAIVNTTVEKSRSVLTEAKLLNDDLSRAARTIESMKSTLAEAQKAAMTDPLTGLFNRRHFMRCLDVAVEESKQNDMTLSLIFADIDNFKSINDNWGHQAGDHILQLVGQLIAANTKGKDVIARFGGEEFVIMLPETGGADAVALAEKIRRAVMEKPFKRRGSGDPIGTITISCGVAEARRNQSAEEFVEAADNALYEAKHCGRNRVVLAGAGRRLRSVG
ncbi:MAG TPA: GGDEF domain-containing protein [Parvularculaceae bacterium]|nr:GGDEF domain-containing protein [Parvularculaceae bacterium]